MLLKRLISVLLFSSLALAQSRPQDSPAESLSKLQAEVEQLKARLNAMKGLEERVALLEQELLEVRVQNQSKPNPAAPVPAKNNIAPPAPPASVAEPVVAAVEPPVIVTAPPPTAAAPVIVRRPEIEEEAPFDPGKVKAAEAAALPALPPAQPAPLATEPAPSVPTPAAPPVQVAEARPVSTLPAPAPAPVAAPPPDPEPDPIRGLPGRGTSGSAAKLDLNVVGKETLVVVVNQQNPLDDISSSQLRDLLLKRVRSWPNKTAVTLVLSDSETELFGRVATTLLHLSALEYQASTVRRTDRRVSSAAPEDLVGLVSNDPTAITVVPAEFAAGRNGVKLLNVAGKSPGEKGYGF